MSNFQSLSDINVNNVNKYITNNDNTVNRTSYSLNKEKFKPNTRETVSAEEMAQEFQDTRNYAFYLSVVNNLGLDKARAFFSEVKGEIEEKSTTEYPVRIPKKYFTWKYRKKYFETVKKKY